MAKRAMTTPAEAGERTRRCAGMEHFLLPLDERPRTALILLSPRRWRRIERILSGTALLPVRTRMRLLRRVLIPRGHDEHLDLRLPAPIAGFDLARRGSRGLRLFDLRERTVALFANDESQFARELRGTELGSRLGIGPRLHDHDAEGRWLREELLPGLDLRDRDHRQAQLEPGAATRLARELLIPLWSATAPQPVPTRELAERLCEEILADLSTGATEPEVGEARRRWAHRLRDELGSLPEAHDTTVPLVWSHGGMNSSSTIEADGRLRLVDWENADLRPPTTDAWHAVSRWYRRRAPAFSEADAVRARGFMEAVRLEVLESDLGWRAELARALEPTGLNIRVWALAALRRRVRRDVRRKGTVVRSPKTDLWLLAIEGMLGIGPNAGPYPAVDREREGCRGVCADL